MFQPFHSFWSYFSALPQEHIGHLQTWGVCLLVSYLFVFSYWSCRSWGKNSKYVYHYLFHKLLGHSVLITHFIVYSFAIFNWNIIALQSSFSFCCTTLWISHIYTYIYSLLSLPPTAPIPPYHRPKSWVPCVIQQLPASYFTHCSVYMSRLLSQFPPLSFPHCVHKSILYTCASIPALQIGSSVAFFSRFLMYAF